MYDYEIIPFINGLSDYDGQLLTLNNIKKQPYEHQSYFTRKINRYTVADFQIKLSYEIWDSVFNGEDVNVIFNSFFKHLSEDILFQFPFNKNKKAAKASWITLGINISCRQKRELYLASRNSNNPIIKEHYKTWCKILSNVIKDAKRLNCDTQIINSNNAIKTTWEIIKLETGRKANNDNIHS
jgi:hypothetical protein